MCIRVDFPDPDGPMIALKLPRENSTLTPRSASTAVGPSPKRRTTSCPATTGASASAPSPAVRGSLWAADSTAPVIAVWGREQGRPHASAGPGRSRVSPAFRAGDPVPCPYWLTDQSISSTQGGLRVGAPRIHPAHEGAVIRG